MNKSAIRGIVALVVFIFCLNIALAANCGDNITTSTTLTSNLTNCVTNSALTINGSDILLDCDGNSISGNISGGAQYGIYISSGAASSFSNITIKNCTISGFYEAIQVDGTLSRVNNTNIIYNTFFSNEYEAIYFSTASTSYAENISYNTILNNTNSDNTGIFLNRVQSSTVQGNIIKNVVGSPVSTEGAIKISTGGGNLIADNFINNSNASCILFRTSTAGNDVIKNNTLSYCNMFGIYLESGISGSVNITENTITNITDLAFNAALRIADGTTSNKLVWHNNIIAGSNAWGIYSFAMNATVNGEGNYWGHGCPTLFTEGVDSPAVGVNDTNPYNETDGWLLHGPGCAAAPIACGDTITTSTTLTANLTGCTGNGLNIAASDLVLDCNGSSIEATGNNYVGINVTGYNNITIQNCNINMFDTSILLSNSNNSNIINNNITSDWNGLTLSYSNFNILSSNNIINSNNYGIRVKDSSRNNTLLDNNDTCSGSGLVIGLSMDVSDYNQIINNTVKSCTSGANVYFSNDVLIQGNNLSNNNVGGSQAGVFIWGSSLGTIINDNHLTGNAYGVLILDSGSTGTLVYHNNIFGNSVRGVSSAVTNLELSNGSEGNYWGRSTCPLFIPETTDSDNLSVVDSYPYNASNGWLSGSPQICAAAPSCVGATINFTCGDNVTESCNMSGNLGPCVNEGFIIGANDVVLNCEGYNITGANAWLGTGINIDSYNNTVITNCNLASFNYGISITNSDNNSLINSSVSNDGNFGLYFDNSDFNIIEYTTFNDTSRLYFSQFNNNTFTGNNIAYGYIQLGSSNDNVFVNNSIDHSSQYGIFMQMSNRNNFTGNTVAYNSQEGLFISDSCSNNTFSDNNFTNNSYDGVYLGADSNYGNAFTNSFSCFNNQSNLSYLDFNNLNESTVFSNTTCDASSPSGLCNNSCDARPVISSTAPINDSTINLEEVNYTLSKTVVSGTIIFSQYGGGPADPDSPHTCLLQGTALDAGIHSNLALATDANACVSWTSLLSGIYYQVTFDAADSLGNNATTVTNTNILFEVIPPTNASLSINYLGGDIEVNSSEVFNVTVNVSCSGSDCGNIDVSLDPSALTLDGNASDMYSSTDSESITISTNSADDIIVLLAGQETANDTSDEPVSVTSVSGANLTWHRRAAANITGDGFDQSSEIWWAYSQYPLAIESITVNFSGQVDDGVLHIFAINGANTADPFDSNPSLPSIVNSGYVPQTNISTSNSNDFIFAMYGCPVYSSANGSVPSDMITLLSTQNNGAHYWEYVDSEYKTVSSIQTGINQTGINVGWVNTTPSIDCSSKFILIADAIQSSEKGLISATPGATPFWTNDSNPRTITLNDSESQLVTFWVNASIAPLVPTNYTFFAYANLSSNASVDAQTNNWTVTVYPNDLTAPVITIVSTSARTNSFQINWTTNESASGNLSFGTTSALGTNVSFGPGQNFSVLLSGLRASTRYFYNITACDINNNCAVYPGNFTTSATTAPSTGGNGGGSGGGVMYSSLPVISSLTDIIASLGLGGDYNYLVIGSPDAHKILIIKIEGKTVTIEFRSTPMRETFAEGETKQIDVNGDSIKDIEFTVLQIFDNSINYRIKGLISGEESTIWKDNISTNAPVAVNTNIVQNAPTATTGAATTAPKPYTQPSPQATAPTVEKEKINWSLIAIVTIVVVIIGVIIVSAVRKNGYYKRFDKFKK